MLNTKTIFSLLMLFAVMLLLNTQNIIAQQPYEIIEIGNGITPIDLNNKNDVVGHIGNLPVLWKNGTVVPLETVNNGNGLANGINNSGEISGRVNVAAGGGVFTAKWNNLGILTFTDNGHYLSFGTKLNDNGTIGGTSAIVGNPSRATIWINDNPFYINMPTGNIEGGCYTHVTDINNNNWAVGSACVPFSNSKTFVWKASGNMVYLPDLGEQSYAYGINNNNLIVGNVQEPVTYSRKAAFWENEILSVIETPVGFTWAEAKDVNSSNEIVGYYREGFANSFGFIFKDGVRTDLNTLLPVNSGWSITKAVAINENGAILAEGLKNGVLGSLILNPKPRYPVFIVPGIAGTYSADTEYDLGWLVIRGVTPNALQIDPLGKVYHDLIATFENVGYERDKDLFVVNYDWRLTPGPIDNNIDGHISGISAASISDSQFDYGVDYLGWYIKKASEVWRSNYNKELDSIDVISHSTGGLVTRSYIQSDAYAGVYDNTNGYRLPRIRNFIMIGVPNRGASKAWNPINDNWIVDKIYRFVLSKIINRAYQKVLQGATISGPDGNIDSTSIKDLQGNPDPLKFINQYVPTIRYLLATYNFIDFGNGYTNVNNNPDLRNTIVLDLNDGMDLNGTSSPNEFLDSAKVTVIYGSGKSTFSLTQKRTDGQTNVVQAFSDWTAGDVTAGTTWYKDLSAFNNGDGTVPTSSSAAQFLSDNRATLVNFSSGDHTELVSKPEVQIMILNILEVEYSSKDISTGSSSDITNVLQVISDPVNLFITDGIGRRLGYSDSTGQVSEIPNSSWYGDSDGVGYVFGSVQQPINLQLIGLGENYYVMVSIEDSTASGGVVLEGFLAPGEVINYQITLDPVSVEEINSVIPQNFALAQNYPNPFNPSTKISWQSPVGSHQTLKIYDVLGNEVATLVDEYREAGRYEVEFDASSLSSGIYFYRLQAGSFVEIKKMILMK